MSSDIGRLHVRRHMKRAVGKSACGARQPFRATFFYIIANDPSTVKKKGTPLTRVPPAGYAGENHVFYQRGIL